MRWYYNNGVLANTVLDDDNNNDNDRESTSDNKPFQAINTAGVINSCFSPDGNTLMTGSWSNTIAKIDLR